VGDELTQVLFWYCASAELRNNGDAVVEYASEVQVDNAVTALPDDVIVVHALSE